MLNRSGEALDGIVDGITQQMEEIQPVAGWHAQPQPPLDSGLRAQHPRHAPA